MAFTEDLTAFFDPREFALEAVYTPSGGAARAVNVIRDAAYLESLGIASTNPTAICRASDVSALSANGQDTLAIGATTYRIKGREPMDDGALVMLQLEER